MSKIQDYLLPAELGPNQYFKRVNMDYTDTWSSRVCYKVGTTHTIAEDKMLAQPLVCTDRVFHCFKEFKDAFSSWGQYRYLIVEGGEVCRDTEFKIVGVHALKVISEIQRKPSNKVALVTVAFPYDPNKNDEYLNVIQKIRQAYNGNSQDTLWVDAHVQDADKPFDRQIKLDRSFDELTKINKQVKS